MQARLSQSTVAPGEQDTTSTPARQALMPHLSLCAPASPPSQTHPLTFPSTEVASAAAKLAQASSHRNHFPAAPGLNSLQMFNTTA